jgi:hypothetical protein
VRPCLEFTLQLGAGGIGVRCPPGVDTRVRPRRSIASERTIVVDSSRCVHACIVSSGVPCFLRVVDATTCFQALLSMSPEGVATMLGSVVLPEQIEFGHLSNPQLMLGEEFCMRSAHTKQAENPFPSRPLRHERFSKLVGGCRTGFAAARPCRGRHIACGAG